MTNFGLEAPLSSKMWWNSGTEFQKSRLLELSKNKHRALVSFLSSRNRSDTVWAVPCTLLALQPSRTEWFVTARLFLAKTQANLCDLRRCVPWAARAIRSAPCTVRGQYFLRTVVAAQRFSHSSSFTAVRAQRSSCQACSVSVSVQPGSYLW